MKHLYYSVLILGMLFQSSISLAQGVTFATGNPLNMGNNAITNLEEPLPGDTTNAATVGYVNNTVSLSADEVRTPIDSLPYTISSPGSYYLTGNLDGSAGGIDIQAWEVTLDLMGFKINGHSYNGYGIKLNNNHFITIKNGTISQFGKAGIFQSSSSAKGTKLLNLSVALNGVLGNGFDYSGIYLAGKNHLVFKVSAGHNGGDGIYVGSDSTVKDSTAYGNENDGIRGGDSATFINNTASDNFAVGIKALDNCLLSNNSAIDNINSTGISGGASCSVNDNVADGNKTGINIVSGVLKGNTARHNTTTGVSASTGSTLVNNQASNNEFGIYTNNGSTLLNNTASFNESWGISAGTGCTIKNNTASNNNQTQNSLKGGIRVGSNSLVIQNTADNNYQTGIEIQGSGTTLRENHAARSTRCFRNGTLNVNAAIGNTAANCTEPFSGVAYSVDIDNHYLGP